MSDKNIKTLVFPIECGEKTCATEPGKFCNFLALNLKGEGLCYFFGRVEEALEGPYKGWIMRHNMCYMHEDISHTPTQNLLQGEECPVFKPEEEC